MAFGGRSQLKMSEETFDFVCTTCAEGNKTVKAVKYCVECSGYCCQSCTEAHTKFPTLKSHNMMDVYQGKQASSQKSSLPEFPTERCSIHNGKLMDMYCEGHDVVGCYVCIVKDHKSCQDSHIHSIPDMIDTIFKLSDCNQTHSLLKDMMTSMQAQSKTKDTQLQMLAEAKKKADDKVMTFQKALETILSKVAESSLKEVEAVYKQLQTELLNKQHTVDSICEDLKKIDVKLNESQGNRAQTFVCSKIAQEKIQYADSEKIKRESHHNADVQISFIPDQSLMEYMKALQSIGKVQSHGKQKKDIYKIKGSSDITMKHSADATSCISTGCCLTHDNQLLFTDWQNKKLKRIDIQKTSVVDHCALDSNPFGVCCISKHEVAVACERDSKIQFVSIHNTMSPTKQINMSHRCYGIAFNDGKLYVTDLSVSVYVYDMTGTRLKTITQDIAGNQLFINSRHVTFNESRDRMFVGGGDTGLVCLDGMGNYLSTFTDTDLKHVDGVCVDGRGNVFAAGYTSHNVVQFTENGKNLGVVVKQADGLKYPRSACFYQGLNRMFVTVQSSDVVKMYELE